MANTPQAPDDIDALVEMVANQVTLEAVLKQLGPRSMEALSLAAAALLFQDKVLDPLDHDFVETPLDTFHGAVDQLNDPNRHALGHIGHVMQLMPEPKAETT